MLITNSTYQRPRLAMAPAAARCDGCAVIGWATWSAICLAPRCFAPGLNLLRRGLWFPLARGGACPFGVGTARRAVSVNASAIHTFESHEWLMK